MVRPFCCLSDVFVYHSSKYQCQVLPALFLVGGQVQLFTCVLLLRNSGLQHGIGHYLPVLSV